MLQNQALAGSLKGPYTKVRILRAEAATQGLQKRLTLMKLLEADMSDVMNNRERGEERKYQMDQEMQFKVDARRNKLLGQWLAEAFGMGPAETKEYAKAVVIADLDEPGIEDVMRKVMADIGERGTNITEDQVREKISELNGVAVQQLREED